MLARIPRDGARATAARLRLDAVLRRRRRPGDDARADGGGARLGRRSQIRTIQQTRARRRDNRRRPRWPMIVLEHAQRLDRAERSSTASRSKAPSARTRCRSPILATNPEHLQLLEELAAELPARGAVRRARTAAAGARGARADRQRAAWAQIRTPTADCCFDELQLPDFPRLRRRRLPAPGVRGIGDTRVLGRFLRDVISSTSERATSGSSDPTRRCRTGSTPCSRRPPGNGTPKLVAERPVARARRAA